jgi:hypothetical protein
MARPTLRHRIARLHPFVWVAVVVAVGALVAWPLGGWDTVALASRTLTPYASNQVLHGHRFDIRIDDAWLTAVHPAYGPVDPEDDEEYLIVSTTVTNVTRDVASSAELDEYIAPEVPGFDPHAFGALDYVLALDDSTLPELNPGLSRDLLLVYTITPGLVTEGEQVRIELSDALQRESFLSYGTTWDTFPAGYAVRKVDRR